MTIANRDSEESNKRMESLATELKEEIRLLKKANLENSDVHFKNIMNTLDGILIILDERILLIRSTFEDERWRRQKEISQPQTEMGKQLLGLVQDYNESFQKELTQAYDAKHEVEEIRILLEPLQLAYEVNRKISSVDEIKNRISNALEGLDHTLEDLRLIQQI